MKKTILACSMALIGWAAQGQVTTYVLQPVDLAGPLVFTFADDSWGTQMPDLADPANRVQEFTVIGEDSLACDPLTNPTEVAGKIAIVYRGACEFGLKALNAQNAGAVACVIVNNGGAPVGMGGGASGGSVTIPVVMISTSDGALIHDEVVAGNVEMLIGSVLNMFPNNLSIANGNMLLPVQAARPALVSMTDSEFSVELGSWVHNYGSDAQANATLMATVTKDGSVVYEETSTAASIASGDSIFFNQPTFSQPGYTGRYELTYTTSLGAEDDFPGDNTYMTPVVFDTLLSFAPEDVNGLPEQVAFFKPSTASQKFEICGFFKDANASRLRVDGMYAAGTLSGNGNMTGQQLSIRLLEWNDDFTGLSDAFFEDISEIMGGEFQYTDSLQGGEVVYIPFFEPTVLVDDQKYLFCVSTSDMDVFLGHSNTVNYEETGIVIDAITTLLNIDDQWSGGWDTGEVPAMGVKMVNATVGIDENQRVELTPYPNPTANRISIPMKGQTGKASVQVFDSKGAKVSDHQIAVGGNNILSMDLTGLDNGLYTFHVVFERGATSSFRVAVSK